MQVFKDKFFISFIEDIIFSTFYEKMNSIITRKSIDLMNINDFSISPLTTPGFRNSSVITVAQVLST